MPAVRSSNRCDLQWYELELESNQMMASLCQYYFLKYYIILLINIANIANIIPQIMTCKSLMNELFISWDIIEG